MAALRPAFANAVFTCLQVSRGTGQGIAVSIAVFAIVTLLLMSRSDMSNQAGKFDSLFASTICRGEN